MTGVGDDNQTTKNIGGGLSSSIPQATVTAHSLKQGATCQIAHGENRNVVIACQQIKRNPILSKREVVKLRRGVVRLHLCAYVRYTGPGLQPELIQ